VVVGHRLRYTIVPLVVGLQVHLDSCNRTVIAPKMDARMAKYARLFGNMELARRSGKFTGMRLQKWPIWGQSVEHQRVTSISEHPSTPIIPVNAVKSRFLKRLRRLVFAENRQKWPNTHQLCFIPGEAIVSGGTRRPCKG